MEININKSYLDTLIFIFIHVVMTWTEAIEQFKHFLQLEQSMSTHSVSAYLSDINKLAKYLAVYDNGPVSGAFRRRVVNGFEQQINF